MEQAERLLGLSPDTAHRWADAGKFPARREGGDGAGRRLIAGRDVAAFAVDLANRAPEDDSGDADL